ncbi:MAG: class I SAM-dependent methyltransferase [Bacteroidia bacterium]|nr:class I SAM-dependent methyltransferase [Bacteroidia bacterium]
MNTTPGLSELLSSFDLELFLTQNKHKAAEDFLLGSKDNTKELNSLLAEQLSVYPKAKNKIPTFVEKACWFTSKSYEQASSETSAFFKSQLIKGRTLLDLSGGLGVDDWAFSKQFEKIISLDPDVFLNQLVRTNFQKLGVNNIRRLDISAEEFLQATKEKFDLIFLDADRRIGQGKAFFLENGKPNFLEIENQCKQICPRVLLKMSPMVDLSYLKKALPFWSKIWVVGYKSEVKEVLVLVDYQPTTQQEIEAVIISENHTPITFSTNQNKTQDMSEPNASEYFFEAHSSIIKSGLSDEYGKFCGLDLFTKNSHYYLGHHIPENFMGRSFRIIQKIAFSKSKVKEYLVQAKIEQANVSKRNFPMQTEELKSLFKLKDGGDNYLFFSLNNEGKKTMIHAVKTN